MGLHWKLDCPECGYSAEISGGDDFGFVGQTTSIICLTCKTLTDVVTKNSEFVSIDLETRESTVLAGGEVFELRCAANSAHPVERWSHPGPCSKCGTTMEGKPSALWD